MSSIAKVKYFNIPGAHYFTIMMMINRTIKKRATTESVPILCRIWKEDGAWNGIAEHLPVAVAGGTFEETRQNLRDAIEGHLQSVIEVGDIKHVLRELRERSHESGFLTAADLSPNSAFVPMQAALRDSELIALT